MIITLEIIGSGYGDFCKSGGVNQEFWKNCAMSLFLTHV